MGLSKNLRLAVPVLILAVGICAQAQQAAEPPLITVTGQAEVKVVPDEVVLKMKVSFVEKELQAAKKLNDERVRKLLALARSYNIEPQNVQTDYISVEEVYREPNDDDWNNKGEKVFVGYAVSKTVIIRLKDITRFESLFSDVVNIGVSDIQNAQFRTSQLRKYKDQARAMAIKAAQEKAIALTKEIGQTIGRAYSIREEGYEQGSVSSNNISSFSVGESASEGESTFAPGQISVSARVTVSFRLQ